jgi:CRISPR/Cas system-associated exonuclease Cas4 (RecB family)
MSNIKFKDICKLINVSKNQDSEKSIADFFVSDLEYSIRKQNQLNKETIVSKTYKPSSLHCIRNMYYQVTGAEVDDISDVSAELIGIGESGTDRHCRIQEAICHMKDNGIDCEYVDVESYIKEFNLPDLVVVEKTDYETKLINTKYNFRFLCDGIIKYRGKYYILEIKTEISFKWNNRTSVDPSHYNQATAYALNFGINNIIFLYENRDTCAKKCYLYNVTNSQIDNLISLISDCDSYVSKLVVPPKPDNLKYNSKICNYCSYKNRCLLE